MGQTGASVEVSGLTVRYGDLVAVDQVDLTVGAGEIVGIIGPNGAGKTSLLECIEGLRPAAAGQVRVDGFDPVADRSRMTAIAGVQLQAGAYPPRVRVGEICRLFAGFYPGGEDYRDLLGEYGLAAAERKPVTALSGGQRQRLSLVLALLGRPRIVFLDELTTGLDPEARRTVWEGLRRRNDDGLTVLLTSHHMDEVEYLCDRVAVMVAGRFVAEGSVGGLVAEHAGGTHRLVAEGAGGNRELRTTLEQVEGVRVTRAGNRLEVELSGPDQRATVERILADARVSSRPLGASLEDAYLALTGTRAGAEAQ
ncbi:MAG TPA: ABC transporter ATP-binding protein [Natronosporangium sp.]